MSLEEAKAELLKEKWAVEQKIWDMVGQSVEDLCKPLREKVFQICKKHNLFFAMDYEDFEDLREDTALEDTEEDLKASIEWDVGMFVSNQFIVAALSEDPSSDWDGSPRNEDIQNGLMEKTSQ